MPTEIVVVRLVLAAVLGGLVGWERETERKPAGLRTHILISLGAAAFVIMGQDLAAISQPVGLDRSRIVAAVVTGMGFLGAGSIIQSRGRVEGLTTAAAMWVVAGIGAATGLGSYTIAIVTTALTLISLRGLGIIANLIAPERARLSEEDDRDSTP